MCPDCYGAGDVSSNGHDPNADIWECDRCLGVGEVECDGCDVCEPGSLDVESGELPWDPRGVV